MSDDLTIARAAKMLPIDQVAWKMGLGIETIRLYGDHMAKIRWQAIEERVNAPRGALVLVTSCSPTPFGEGKTTQSIGLAQALSSLGRSSACTLREPSMGPVFGLKGGAAGGGHAQVIPMDELNLHFTGDFHAISAAHNLLAAMIDNHIHHRLEPRLEIGRVTWPRVVDMNDRALRKIVVGLGGPENGVARETRFDITAASEVMAILSLANSPADLRERLGRIIIGEDLEGGPVTAEDIGAAGAMALLLREAIQPNLIQTLEQTPAFIHGGPFANIAHGNSSVMADLAAVACTDIVITEAGFGADLGAEKFFHIKVPSSDRPADAIVLNATVRAMKLHGGGFSTSASQRPNKEEIERENVASVRDGVRTNLTRHIQNLLRFGPPVIVAVNRFASDHPSELKALVEEARAAGAHDAVISEVHTRGGEGGHDLARAVIAATEEHIANGRPFTPIVAPRGNILESIETIATEIYGAKGISMSKRAQRSLERITTWGYDTVPACMAKTQYSLSHDPALLGAPEEFILPIEDIRLNAGAGFAVVLCGSIMTMPGLGRQPAASDMDLDPSGKITGAFG